MSAPTERIQSLEQIEKDVVTCLQSAGEALKELSKEKSSLKQVEGHTHQFLKALTHVESKLSEQINYLTQVSTGQPHEGSGYASQKVLQMAWHRLEHARSRLSELERLKNKHLQDALKQQQQYHQQNQIYQQQQIYQQTTQSLQQQQQLTQPLQQQQTLGVPLQQTPQPQQMLSSQSQQSTQQQQISTQSAQQSLSQSQSQMGGSGFHNYS